MPILRQRAPDSCPSFYSSLKSSSASLYRLSVKSSLARSKSACCAMMGHAPSSTVRKIAIRENSFIVYFSALQSRLLFYLYRSEEHTSELQSRGHLVCRLLLEKK